MTRMPSRASLLLIAVLVTIALASCDHYVCGSGANFGTSNCTAGSPGLGATGSGGSATAAFAFAVDQGPGTTGATGTIDGFTLNTTANTFGPTPGYTAPAIPGNDFGTGMVVAQSQFLYAGFGSTDQLFGWSVSSTGTLTAIGGSPFAASFMAGVGGGGTGTNSIIANPAGTLLFLADTFSDQIFVYQIGADGSLTAATPASITVPFEPVNLTNDGLGNYLYATELFGNHEGNQIAAYAIDSSTGSLTPVVGSPFPFPMWQVQGEPTGKYLIGTTGRNLAVNGADDDHLYVFSITPSGSADAGAIAAVAGSPFQTQLSPYSIAVQPDSSGSLVYSFGFNDTFTGFNSVEGYSINSSGTLTAVGGSPFSNAALGSWGQFDQSGAFLFAFGGVDDINTGMITYQLSAFDVSSAGLLAQPTSTLDLTTGGFWTVTDPK